MATPTQAELETQLKNICKLYNETRKYGSTNANNYVGMQDTIEQAIEGDHADQMTASVRAARASLADCIGNLGAALDANLRDWGRFIKSDFEEGDIQLLISDIYRYWHNNTPSPITVQRRNPSFATMAAAGGNTGTGQVKRLTVDKKNYVIENVTPEKKTIRCFADHSSGVDKGKEKFRLFGESSGRDIVESRGSGLGASIELQAQHSSFSLLKNPSFDVLDGTVAAPTTIPNWTVGAVGNFELDNTNVALPAPNDNVTVRGLRIKANETLTQKLVNIRQSLNKDLPYLLRIWYNKTPGAVTAGTLTIRMGSQSVSVDLATAGANWQILEIAINQNVWFENFNEDSLDIQIQLTGLAGTYLVVDDVTFVPWTAHDGTWWIVFPGRTPFKVEDEFTGTDTIASDSVVQRTIVHRHGRFVPHSATPSIADPA